MYIKKTPYFAVSLFEVLTAIIIFSTWILVLLSMIGSNIVRVKTIRIKDNATMLAKEAIEIIYNMRDSNLEKWLARYCWEFDDTAGDNCWFPMYQWWTWTSYILDWDIAIATGEDNMYSLLPFTSLEETRLYYHTWQSNVSWLNLDIFWYNHDSSGGISTPYSRYIVIKPVDAYASNTGNILQIQVHVTADQWTRDYELILESLLGDIR